MKEEEGDGVHESREGDGKTLVNIGHERGKE